MSETHDEKLSVGRTRDITREELFERVWLEPTVKVAARYGVSDVAVAKWCRKLKVPKPPPGYWRRVETGQKPKRPKLPKLKKGDVDFVWRPDPRRVAGESGGTGVGPEGVERIPDPITISTDLRAAHELVRQTSRILRDADQDKFGILERGSWSCLTIDVCQKCLRRALIIFDSLIGALEEAGFPVAVEAREDAQGEVIGFRTVIVASGETVSFGLSEQTVQEEREPTEEEKAKQARRRWYLREPYYDYIATGKLTLSIHSGRQGYGLQRNWNESEKTPIEQRLYHFVKSLLITGEFLRKKRIEDEERAREWERQRLEREERERLWEEEQRRRWSLEASAQAWHRCQRLRVFIAAIEAQLERGTPPQEELEEIAAWLDWAKGYIAQTDPLSTSENLLERMLEAGDKLRKKSDSSNMFRDSQLYFERPFTGYHGRRRWW